MARLNLILLALLTACALGLVTSQHQARKLFIELEQEQERARQLEVEYGQLQLESSTWGMHARIERIARQGLRMRLPDASRVKIIESMEKSGGKSGGAAAAGNAGSGGVGQ